MINSSSHTVPCQVGPFFYTCIMFPCLGYASFSLIGRIFPAYNSELRKKLVCDWLVTAKIVTHFRPPRSVNEQFLETSKILEEERSLFEAGRGFLRFSSKFLLFFDEEFFRS